MSCKQTIVLLVLLVSALSLFAKTKDKEYHEGWLPITQQDLSVKEVPNDPGADAIQLYMSYYKDDDAKFISVYKRIRILRESGRERANVEIPIEPGQSLKELAARTILPDQQMSIYFNHAGWPQRSAGFFGVGILQEVRLRIGCPSWKTIEWSEFEQHKSV